MRLRPSQSRLGPSRKLRGAGGRGNADGALRGGNASMLLEESFNAFSVGNIGPLLVRVDEFVSCLEQPTLDESQRILLKVFAAHFSLLLFDKRRAAGVLDPFVRFDGQTLTVDTLLRSPTGELSISGALAHGCGGVSSKFVAGLLYAHIANLLYRCLRFEEGAFLAGAAVTLLRSRDANIHSSYCSVAELEARVWLARLKLKSGRRLEAETSLEELIAEWEHSEGDPGIDRVMAIALDLASAADWSRGRPTAKIKAYRSLALLAGLDDPIHLAHARLTNARIYMSHSTNLQRALYRLQQAAHTFNRYGHVTMEARTRLLRAQALTRARRIVEAWHLVREIDPERVGSPLHKTHLADPHERALAEAEWHLTRSWLFEHDARAGNLAAWESCGKEAAMLVGEERPLPMRLRAEGYLHYGLALAHSADAERRTQGRTELATAIAVADADARTKIRVAALFALAESHLTDDVTRAQQYWREGMRVLATLQSHFLNRWREALAEKMGAPLTIEVDPKSTLRAAERAFRIRFIRYHQARGDVGATMPKPTLYRYLKLYERDLARRDSSYSAYCKRCDQLVLECFQLADVELTVLRKHLDEFHRDEGNAAEESHPSSIIGQYRMCFGDPVPSTSRAAE